MTNTPDSAADQGARIDLLTEQISELKATIAAFTDRAVALLSGQPQTAARRPGRPVGSRNRPVEAPVAPEPKPYHPLAAKALEIVQRGAATQSDLARALDTPNSGVAHHMKALMKDGKVKKVDLYVGNRPIVMYEKR